MEFQKLRRPSLDATQDERRHYFHDLRDALTSAGVEPGEEFVVVNADTFAHGPFALPDDGSLASGPAAEDPSANGLGGFARKSDTSRKAALDNYPRSGTQRERVLKHFYVLEVRSPGHGFTRDELCVDLGMAPNVLTPRVKELIDGDWLEETELVRKTRAGSEAHVLMLTEKAKSAARSGD